MLSKIKILFSSQSIKLLQILSTKYEIYKTNNWQVDILLSDYNCFIFDDIDININLYQMQDKLYNIKFICVTSIEYIHKYYIFDSVILLPTNDNIIFYQINMLFLYKNSSNNNTLYTLLEYIENIFNSLYIYSTISNIILGAWLCELCKICIDCNINSFYKMQDLTINLYKSQNTNFAYQIDTLLKNHNKLQCITLLYNVLLHISIFNNPHIIITDHYIKTNDLSILHNMLFRDLLNNIIKYYKLNIVIEEDYIKILYK